MAKSKDNVYIQTEGNQFDVTDIITRVKKDFRSEFKKTPVTSCKIYIKPQEGVAYYVVNDTISGSVSLMSN